MLVVLITLLTLKSGAGASAGLAQYDADFGLQLLQEEADALA